VNVFRRSAAYWGRLVVFAAAAFVAWFVLDRYVSGWLGAVVGFVVLGIASAFIADRAPRLVELTTGADPLRAIVGEDSSVYNEGWSLALQHLHAEADRPKAGTSLLEARRHFIESGAFDVEATSMRLALEGRSADTVTVTGLRAVISEAGPPIAATLVRAQSAGEGKVIRLEINLDESNPVARSSDGEDWFRAGYITLVKGEVQVFQLVARAEAGAYVWELEVLYRVRESEATTRLDNSGVPFRTSGRAGSFLQSYDWAWFEGPDARLIPLPEP
jgi:hypothetical protein